MPIERAVANMRCLVGRPGGVVVGSLAAMDAEARHRPWWGHWGRGGGAKVRVQMVKANRGHRVV